ncbi:MAG: hypothetical protein ACJ74Q_15905 [Pyrinomonadaceae bacterium]
MRSSHSRRGERGASLIEYLIGAAILFLMLVVGAAVMAKMNSTTAAYLEVSELEQQRSDLADTLRTDFDGAGRNLTRAEPSGTGTEYWTAPSDSYYSVSPGTITRTLSNASMPWKDATRGFGSGLGYITFTGNTPTFHAELLGADGASRRISISNNTVYLYEDNNLSAASFSWPGTALVTPHQAGDTYRIAIADTPTGRAVCYYRGRAGTETLLYQSTKPLPAYPITPRLAIYNTGSFSDLKISGGPIIPLIDGAVQTAPLPFDRGQRLTGPVTINGNTVTLLSGDPDTDVLYNKGPVVGTGTGTFLPLALPKRGTFKAGDYALLTDYQSARSGLYKVTSLDTSNGAITLTLVVQSDAAWGRLWSDPSDPLPSWPTGSTLVKLLPPVTYQVSADSRLVRMEGSRPATAAFGVRSASCTEQSTAVSKSYVLAVTLAAEGFQTDQSAASEPRDTVEYKSSPPALNLFNNELNTTR